MILAFAIIDPKTFEVHPMHPDDESIYEQFLALPNGVEKWIVSVQIGDKIHKFL